MTTETRFVADDGSEWKTVEEASKRDQLQRYRAGINEILGSKRPNHNGEEYVQHDARAVALFIQGVAGGLAAYVSLEMKDKWLECPRGIVGRYLDDSDSPFYRDYWRLICIDSQNREWGQPYFANNPNAEAREAK